MFFGQKSALKAQYNKESKSIYIGVGKKSDDNKWSWNNAKIKDTEAAEIIRILQGQTESVSFYHTFNDSKRQIWVTRKEEQLFVKIDSNSKGINLGEQDTIALRDLIVLNEKNLGKEAIIEKLPDQPGDVPVTYADISRAKEMLGYAPKVKVADGVRRFVKWYQEETNHN